MQFIHKAGLVLAVSTLGAAAPTASAQTYNAAGDFSVTSNPNGVWSYGYEAGNGTFVPYTAEGSFQNIDFWYLSGTGLPDLGKNNTATRQGFLNPGKLMFHPGNDQALADYSSIVRWTAPSAGIYALSTVFTGIDTRGLDVDVEVARDGISVFSGNLIGAGSQQDFSATYTLAANDTIDYVVSNQYNATTGTYSNVGDKNFVQLDATINSSPVPEASSVVSLGFLLLLGVGSLAVSRRRKIGATR